MEEGLDHKSAPKRKATAFYRKGIGLSLAL
jgi:hypothetical protein